MSAGAQPAAPRILLVDPREQRRAARAKKLLSLGYRVSALASSDKPPRRLSHRLYEAVVVSAEDSSVSLSWCERTNGNDAKPLIIVLASGLFAMDGVSLPAVVITEPTVKAAEEKLLAFLASATPSGSTGD